MTKSKPKKSLFRVMEGYALLYQGHSEEIAKEFFTQAALREQVTTKLQVYKEDWETLDFSEVVFPII